MAQDSTLIQTSSGKKFASDAQDWKWWHASVPGMIRKMYLEDGQVTHSLSTRFLLTSEQFHRCYRQQSRRNSFEAWCKNTKNSSFESGEFQDKSGSGLQPAGHTDQHLRSYRKGQLSETENWHVDRNPRRLRHQSC
jgi:hypothetical protein